MHTSVSNFDLCPSIRLSIGRTGRRLGLLLGGAVVALGGSLPVHANLMINVAYPNPADVPVVAMNEITSVVNLLDSSFTNNAINTPINVNVTVDFTAACGQGCSSTGRVGPTYAQWRTQMIADSTANPQNTFLAAAIPTLPAADPMAGIGGNGTVLVRRADAKMLGFTVAAGNDSALTFSNAANKFEFTGVATPGLVDFQNVFEHELDEALGIGSTLTGIANNGALPASFEPEDYFRYDAAGNRSLTTNPTANVFFSYNATTDVKQFNQNDAACGHAGAPNDSVDRNDWIDGIGPPCTAPATPFVQDAIGFVNQVASYGPGSPEFAVLETLGYDPVPEPGTLVLLGTSLLGLAALRRRRQ